MTTTKASSNQMRTINRTRKLNTDRPGYGDVQEGATQGRLDETAYIRLETLLYTDGREGRYWYNAWTTAR